MQPTADAIAAAQGAQGAQAAWKIPASVQLAQWALESAWGKKTSGAFNYFGMKAKPGQPFEMILTHEVFKGQRVKVMAAFRKFGSALEAFDAHARLLATAPVYAPARAALPDVFAFCDELTMRYATDPHYGDTLGAIIRGSTLTRYDA